MMEEEETETEDWKITSCRVDAEMKQKGWRVTFLREGQDWTVDSTMTLLKRRGALREAPGRIWG